jgi:hypothetical protein
MDKTMPSTAAFKLVGYRFSRLFIDEEAVDKFKKKGASAKLVVSFEGDDPEIAQSKWHDRAVIELRIKLGLGVGKGGEAMLFEVKCIAGFVGRRIADDGNIEQFRDGAQEFARSLYWLSRQRIVSLMTMTRFRSIVLPWDVPDEADEDRPVVKKKTAIKRKPARGSQA